MLDYETTGGVAVHQDYRVPGPGVMHRVMARVGLELEIHEGRDFGFGPPEKLELGLPGRPVNGG